MNDECKNLWDQAEETGAEIPLGDHVSCDFCGEDWTKSTKSGGFVFQSKAVCPDCAPTSMASIRRYGEERFIRALCPPEKSFADFVREFRGPGASIKIISS